MICGPIPPSEPQENHWLVQLAIQSPACPMSPTHVLKCNLSPTWKVETRPSSPDMPQGPPRQIPHLIQYSPHGLMQWIVRGLPLPPVPPHLFLSLPISLRSFPTSRDVFQARAIFRRPSQEAAQPRTASHGIARPVTAAFQIWEAWYCIWSLVYTHFALTKVP